MTVDNEVDEIFKSNIIKSNKFNTAVDPETGEVYTYVSEARKRELREQRREAYLQYSDIPKEYWKFRFDNKDLDGQINMSRGLILEGLDFIDNFDKKNTCLYLWGNQNATGKTTLACAIAQELMLKGYSCFFSYAKTLIDNMMKLSGFNNDEDSQYYIDRIKNSDVVVIDDIFDPNKSLYWNSKNNNVIISEWDSIIRYCLNDNKKLILTSNKSRDEVASLYSKDIASLLDRGFKFIHFKESVLEARQKRL
jgi:DNA replication protein DnaC